ncbi:MAG: PatB family C-S lyase [Muribaculaceae bacterium]|nr:PatB family C-S lyase [Muribaculaceae bacterium]
MSIYDFDKVVERRGSGALKYDALQERYGNSDLLPYWVADMDFETPPFIIEALRRRLDHPILGYTVTPEEFWQSIIRWTYDRHGWEIKKEWLSYIPGIVKGIGMVINVFTSPGDEVIIQTPVYHLFRMVPEGNGREVLENPLLIQADGYYKIDFDGLEELAARERCKLLILSNPHNPVGITWTREELARVADICRRHGVMVISDEIHCDMTLWGHLHVPFATASDAARDISITFAAPTKTFNMAGIVSSYSVIPNPEIRERFYSWLDANELSEPTIFAPIATVAAYNEGNTWREEMLRYVEENIDFIADYCEKHLPGIKAVKPQASFLVWLDCRGLKMTQTELVKLFTEKAGLALNDGAMFGTGGEGFMRFNAGAPRRLVAAALDRLRTACGAATECTYVSR